MSREDWSSWRWHFKNSLSRFDDFAKYFSLSVSEREALQRSPAFQVRATPYYCALASRENPQEAIRRMIISTLAEFAQDGQQMADPLGERKHSPLERLIHRYPDRVLFSGDRSMFTVLPLLPA